MTGELAGVPLYAALPAATQVRVAAALQEVHVPAGRWLFHQGDPGESMYVVRSGLLHVVKESSDPPEVVATQPVGSSFGEVALLEGGRRSAGVQAVRESVLWRLDEGQFRGLLEDPDFTRALLAGLSRQLRAASAEPPDPRRGHAVVSVVDCRSEPGHVGLAEALADQLKAFGAVAHIRIADVVAADADLPIATARMLDDAERGHDFVVLHAHTHPGRPGGDHEHPGDHDRWMDLCARQADRVLVVVDHLAPSRLPQALQERAEGCDVVVLAARAPDEHALRRLSVVHPLAWHRVDPHDPQVGVARVARRLAGRAVGVVLGGGGARGFAHLGVLQALADHGVVVDRYGGTSMGALVSAMAATGRPLAQVVATARSQLSGRRPFSDWTIVPRHALVRGRRAERLLVGLFGTTDIRQLPHPWFAISATLGSAEMVTHHEGEVWRAVGASMSVPGVVAPRRDGDRFLIDGGVVRNLPVDVMAGSGDGPIIAVDVARRLTPRHDPDGSLQLPTILETIGLSMGLASRAEHDRQAGLARLMIEPRLPTVGLFDWDSFDVAVEAGRVAAEEALEAAGDLAAPATAA